MKRAQPLSTLLVVCSLLVPLWTGCSSIKLHRFEQRAANGDDQWIVRQNVRCDQASVTCARLHLIKGDACLRLADSDPAPERHYACAADAFEKGLALISSRSGNGSLTQAREDLCRSLLNLGRQQPAEKSDETLSRLSRAAKGLFRSAPESASATYYLACVPLYRAQSMLPDIPPASRTIVCSRLKRSLTRVLSMRGKSKEKPPTDWNRFADKYDRLSFDLGMTMLAAQCL